MKTIEELEFNVLQVTLALTTAEEALALAIADVNNNVYDNLEKACSIIEERLQDKAHNACEGSYSRGEDTHKQLFIVDGVKYEAVLEVEYNRHDKTYYFVDGSSFSYGHVDTETDNA